MRFQKEDQLLNLLKKEVDNRAFSKNVAVLDADGTLWFEDANDILLKYEIRKNLRDNQDLLDPYYAEEGYRHKRCEIFAKRQAGFTIEEFRAHCLSALKENPLHIFPFQRELLEYLKQKSMEIFIVTASMKWLVEEAIKLYKLPVDKVLGVELKQEGNKISEEFVMPAPFSHSKAEVFLQHSSREKCFLAGGNSFSDKPLLDMAELSFVVHSALKEDEMFLAEERFKKQALKKNWIVFERDK